MDNNIGKFNVAQSLIASASINWNVLFHADVTFNELTGKVHTKNDKIKTKNFI